MSAAPPYSSRPPLPIESGSKLRSPVSERKPYLHYTTNEVKLLVDSDPSSLFCGVPGGIIIFNCTFSSHKLLSIIGTTDLVPVPLPGADYTWTKRTSKHCWNAKHPTKYSAFEQAIYACHKLGTSCAGVYDVKCDGVGNFYTCKSGHSLTYDRDDCVYTPDRSGWCNWAVPCVGYDHAVVK